MVTEPQITEDDSAPVLPPGPGAVSFSGVQFAYHGARHFGGHRAADVLRDFDLEIAGGESVALVGPTGCGKSTVARLIPRFYDVAAGSVSIDGHDVRDVRLGSLRREIGLVFEETFLFSDTVWENLAFAAGGSESDISHDRIVRAAELAGADEFIRALPDGYDTMLGEHGFSLSGGQRQRLAIARAILADPRVLILDDATSAVDPSKEHEIRAALSEVMQGRTTLIIAHRPATIALADRVVLMDEDGRVVATGAHTDLLATSAQYRQVLADISQLGDDGAHGAPVLGRRGGAVTLDFIAIDDDDDGLPEAPEVARRTLRAAAAVEVEARRGVVLHPRPGRR